MSAGSAAGMVKRVLGWTIAIIALLTLLPATLQMLLQIARDPGNVSLIVSYHLNRLLVVVFALVEANIPLIALIIVALMIWGHLKKH